MQGCSIQGTAAQSRPCAGWQAPPLPPPLLPSLHPVTLPVRFTSGQLPPEPASWPSGSPPPSPPLPPPPWPPLILLQVHKLVCQGLPIRFSALAQHSGISCICVRVMEIRLSGQLLCVDVHQMLQSHCSSTWRLLGGSKLAQHSTAQYSSRL